MLARMNAVLFCGGRVLDPASRRNEIADLLIHQGKIAAIGSPARSSLPPGTIRIKANGWIICPGLIDAHVHLREPGQTGKESIATGTAAAARGGFTSVLCMPNTNPPIDHTNAVAFLRDKAAHDAAVNVYVAGAITKNTAGEELAPIGSLHKAGIVAITDDGHCIQNNELMRRALEYATMFNLPVLDHCQDYSLVTDGVMHEGYWSTLLGLRGWPAIGEDTIVSRNILLAETTGARVHCQHLSSAKSVALLREAKAHGLPITGEACPHHFTLTDAAVAGSDHYWPSDGRTFWQRAKRDQPPPSWPSYDTNLKMNPPLRASQDREAIIAGLADGTIEIIASDHAPHCNFEKEVEFDYAPFGITGLETELALSLTQLYHTKRMPLVEVVSRFTIGPARLLGLDKGTLALGKDADITLINPDLEWTFTRENTASKSHNSPFYGWPLKGKAIATWVAGQLIWSDVKLAPGLKARLT
jgi:dihydroorotase